ncbi:MFS transporter [Nitratireductor rhodophyticola]|uniref:MFS transporter n=1 Tax=Nitratireductor rhodophyticola TaxID=2854036 RepID=UPI002AC9A433|nr:MFS transporter [Nitratireductor rhodophyticola]WPZ15561.1 MFS transporter [Nitratireductor rhodophyticola]
MLSPLGSIIALLLGTAFLLTGSGLHGLLLPLRGQMEGFPTASLGALGAAWAAGFVAGCFVAPRIVRRAGHVRAFGAFAASGAIIALLTGMWVDPTGWVILRIFTGFTMAGAFMVIESWLNEKSTNENRGTVFGIYMMLTYASLTAGQMTVAFGDVSNTILFMTTGILFCMALIPTAVSKAVSPEPLTQASLDLKGLYVNSPVAFLGCVLVGIANGAWGTLGAVYGGQIGISTLQIATMMSIAVLAGAALQLPAGRLSDRMDRRFVISGAAFGSGLVGLLILLTAPRDGTYVIAMTGVYGAFAYTLYSIIVAHANDHASPEDFVKVASGLLVLYGFGTMIGPLIGGVLMEIMPPESLFLITALAHFGLGAYALLRISQRAPVPVDEREAFKTLPAERAVTPQAAVLDPRSDTEESLTETVE